METLDTCEKRNETSFSHESECALTIGPLVNHLVDLHLQTPLSEVHYRGFLMGFFICPYRFNTADLPLSGLSL